jgi:hypothetical protein
MTADPEAARERFSKLLLVASALTERRYSGSDLRRQLEIPARDAA